MSFRLANLDFALNVKRLKTLNVNLDIGTMASNSYAFLYHARWHWISGVIIFSHFKISIWLGAKNFYEFWLELQVRTQLITNPPKVGTQMIN